MDTFLSKLEKLIFIHDKIAPEIIDKKDVKLGLRNKDGSGVPVGITTKGRVVGYKKVPDKNDEKNRKVIPAVGRLYYCGYDVEKIVQSVEEHNKFGFEEVAYLLLTGELPSKSDFPKFTSELAKRRPLSKTEKRIIMEEVQNENQMYALHSVISHMSRCDPKATSVSIEDVTRQSINLIAKFPTVVANNYSVMRYAKGSDLSLRRPKPEFSTAENFLYMIRGGIPDPYEAHLFDIALILHAEHGGGNNSTFTVRTVSSSGANTYMAIAAGIASLSGHLHGGANESVKIMMQDLRRNISNWDSEKEIRAYLKKLMDKKANDKTGKIYGFGHAVYTLSDPRAIILKKHAGIMAERKGAMDEFNLFLKVEEIASKLLSEKQGKPINANVDFYSGFIYKLMGIPRELYTPIFAMARVVGWCAHRIEQIIQGKIMRPAYLSVSLDEFEYHDIKNRKK